MLWGLIAATDAVWGVVVVETSLLLKMHDAAKPSASNRCALFLLSHLGSLSRRRGASGLTLCRGTLNVRHMVPRASYGNLRELVVRHDPLSVPRHVDWSTGSPACLRGDQPDESLLQNDSEGLVQNDPCMLVVAFDELQNDVVRSVHVHAVALPSPSDGILSSAW